ncbi:MAG: TonB-dependent receptor [Flavobacteriales bacterium]
MHDHPLRLLLGILCACVLYIGASAQVQPLRGIVTDGTTGEALVGAAVKVKDGTGSAVTDLDGRFTLNTPQAPPFTIMVTYTGYLSREIAVSTLTDEVKVKLATDDVMLQEAQVVADRISDKQKQAPLTVETMDLLAIKEAASGDFYESLGTLKGVDMTAASFGFKVINTRGFNSTSPVRSLQLIDGVDNQSPGLNFSLGNFLGASDLDVLKVDVIAGASTAYYGPGAFNGVINMTTKSPWTFPGLSVSLKGGERNMLEAAVRWAEVIKNKEGRARWAYKLNAFALRADDWWAQNYAPTENSPTNATNPGRFDAVNIYGDENTTVNNDYTRDMFERRNYPGLGLFLRNGYAEKDLVNYNTDNLKLGGAVHYRTSDSIEVIAASNFSTGSTVYQGDNRYRLKDVKFYQQRLEVQKPGTWYVRAYTTSEDAGKTYDIFTTAVRMQEMSGSTSDWNTAYMNLWNSWITPMLNNNSTHPDFYSPGSEAVAHGITTAQAYDEYLTGYVDSHNAMFSTYHQMVMDSVNSLTAVSPRVTPFLQPGTAAFNDRFNEVTSKKFTEGGSLFYDRSRLYHVMGEYHFKPAFGEVIVGGNQRWYLPNSAGTIFKDTGSVVIRNQEFGVYTGLQKQLIADKLKSTLTVRMDKNQNFNALFSPAASLVYTPRPDRVFRLSFGSAVRNPTLADQYFYYNVGRALLLGNVEGQFEQGRDSLFTAESFDTYRSNANLANGLRSLDYFHVDRLRPEQVRTIEVGYRGTHFDKFYVDMNYYRSWYRDFIGYVIGLDAQFDPATGYPASPLQVYRLAANASEQVITQGVTVGLTYYRTHATYSGNYSWNVLTSGKNDPIIPAFNTPANKFNLGLSVHDLKIPGTDRRGLGYGINYRFVEGYRFAGSPQFSGMLPSYDMVDAQVSVTFPKVHTTVKLGASNLFGVAPFFDRNVPSGEKLDHAWNNNVMLVFGGPYVGRLAYLQLSYELDQR